MLLICGFVGAIMLSPPVMGEIYKWKDAKGTWHFSQDPPLEEGKSYDRQKEISPESGPQSSSSPKKIIIKPKRVLIDEATDGNLKPPKQGIPFLDAVVDGDFEKVKSELHRGVDINTSNKFGSTALHLAARTGRPVITEWLIKMGAQVNKLNKDGQTPFFYAAYCGQLNIMKILVKNGADINQKELEYGWTPIHGAARGGYTDAIIYLLENGADVNSRKKDGKTPLILAVIYDRPSIAHLLLKNGAEVNSRDNEGFTPLFMAAECCNDASVSLLLEYDATVSVRNNQNESLISMACIDSVRESPRAKKIVAFLKYVEKYGHEAFRQNLTALEKQYSQ